MAAMQSDIRMCFACGTHSAVCLLIYYGAFRGIASRLEQSERLTDLAQEAVLADASILGRGNAVKESLRFLSCFFHAAEPGGNTMESAASLVPFSARERTLQCWLELPVGTYVLKCQHEAHLATVLRTARLVWSLSRSFSLWECS